MELNVDNWAETYSLPEGMVREMWDDLAKDFYGLYKRTKEVAEPPAATQEEKGTWPSPAILKDFYNVQNCLPLR